MQRIILLQQLKEEIDKDSCGKIRYRDSELYKRNLDRFSGSVVSELQGTTLNLGGTSNTKQSGRITSYTSSHASSKKEAASNDTSDSADDHRHGSTINRNCLVCLIKDARQDLMKMSKEVQRRNEQISKQISKQKAKCLRSYFEKQI